MIINVRLSGKELKEIEDIVSKGEVGSIQDFIKYSIHNQLQIERDEEEGKVKRDSSLALNKVGNKTSDNVKSNIKRINLPAINSHNIVSLDKEKIKKRTEQPIWALKNRYFPLKFVLRIVQKLSESDGKVPLRSLDNEIKKFAFLMRTEMEKLDNKLDNKRGSKFSSGFPVNSEQSYYRFFNNFVIYISSDGEMIKGLPYELGFIDYKDESVVLTEDGNIFANLYSPVFDSYLKENKEPKSQYSEDEVNFLCEHIKHKTNSEKRLFEFVISQIKNGNNTPEKLKDMIIPFLEEELPKEDGYSEKAANSIRASLISRMAELNIIKIEKNKGRSSYKIGKNAKLFDLRGG